MKISKHNPAIPTNHYHTTVLLEEAVEALQPQDGKCYLDATFGGGGHTRAILSAHPTCKVVAFDWDQEAIEHNAGPLKEEFGDRLTIIWGNFAHCYRLLKKNGITQLDGALADFGTSQFQIHHEDGFSFNTDTPLDMRMSKAHHYFNAEHVVNKFEERQLADILFTYGEERHARKIVAAIAKIRTIAPIRTTKQLADIVTKAVPSRGHQDVFTQQLEPFKHFVFL